MLLLIACGNSLRQDDGAGHALARHICEVGHQQGLLVELLQVQQLLPELALSLARPGVTSVVFVDTRQVAPDETSPCVEVNRLDGGEALAVLGHHLTPATLLAYAERLYGSRPVAWLVTVPGLAFGYGETFSPLTRQALAEAMRAAPWLRFLPNF